MALQEGREEALKLEVGVQQQEALEIKAATLHRKDMLEETTPMLLLTMALVVVVGQPPLVKMDLHLEVELVALEPLTLLQVLQLLMPEAVEVALKAEAPLRGEPDRGLVSLSLGDLAHSLGSSSSSSSNGRSAVSHGYEMSD
jgi:hypothetical protein